jgi:hypothetical protein
MKRANAVLVVAGAGVLVAAAWFLAQGRGPSGERERGSAVMPDLEKRAGEVSAIEVSRGTATVRLENRKDAGWTIATSDGYPARTELVRALVASLAGLTYEDKMTAKPERHKELALAWPDAEGKARLVRFVGADPGAKPVAELVIGEERFSPDAVFVRAPDQEQTWRARGRVQIPDDAMGWMDRSLLVLPTDETMSVDFDGLTLARPADTAPAADGARRPWEAKVDDAQRASWSDAQQESARLGLPSFLERLEFEAVRRARGDVAKEPRWTATFDLKTGTVTLAGHEEPEGVWFTLTAFPKPDAPKATPPANEYDPYVPDWSAFAARTAGWEYRMPSWKADTLRRMREAPAPAPAQAEPGAENPG